MDDLIVIILTLIIAVVGVLGQVKKKKQAEGTGAGNSTGDIWDLFQEQDNFQEAEKVTEFYEEDEKTLESFDTLVYQFDAVKEGSALIKGKNIPEDTAISEKVEDKEKFSLKKAVIYSEILNRKYI